MAFETVGKLRVLDRIYAVFGVPAATVRDEAMARADTAIEMASHVHARSNEVVEENVQLDDDPLLHIIQRLDELL